MKKILFILLLLPVFTSAQNEPGGYQDNRAFINQLTAGKYFMLPKFVDTATANTAGIKDSCGQMIYVTSEKKVRVRNCNPDVWSEVGGSGGSGTVTSFTATDGNGFDFSVANSTTTPTLTATTTVSTGQVMYSNSGAITGSSNLVWDNTNGRLGIATASPGFPLQITSTATGYGSYNVGLSILGTFPAWEALTTNRQNGTAFNTEPASGLWKFTQIVSGSPSDLVKGDFPNNTFNIAYGKVGIGFLTAPAEALHVTGNVRFSGALMPNNSAGTTGQVLTSAGTGAPPTWTSSGNDSYTPTATNGANVDASTPLPIVWIRLGSTVSYSGMIQIDATATGAAVVELTLPPGITSDFTNTYDAPGLIGQVDDVTSAGRGVIVAQTTNNRLQLTVNATSTSTLTYTFTGSFRVL